MEVYCDGKFVSSSFKDYSSLTLFTDYDGEANIKTSIKVPPGDVTIMVYHARQSFAGSILSSAASAAATSSSSIPGATKIKICQVYFNPANVSSTRTHVRFPTHEVDSMASLDRIPADFAVSVNFQRKDASRTEKFPYVLPDRRKLDLVFASKGEYAEACSIAGASASSSSTSGQASKDDEEPPRYRTNILAVGTRELALFYSFLIH